jgi:hypothetical protein
MKSHIKSQQGTFDSSIIFLHDSESAFFLRSLMQQKTEFKNKCNLYVKQMESEIMRLFKQARKKSDIHKLHDIL